MDPEESGRYDEAAGKVVAGADSVGESVGDLTSRLGRDMRRMVWWAMAIATGVVIVNLVREQPTEVDPGSIVILWLINVLIWMALLAIGAHFARRLRDSR